MIIFIYFTIFSATHRYFVGHPMQRNRYGVAVGTHGLGRFGAGQQGGCRRRHVRHRLRHPQGVCAGAHQHHARCDTAHRALPAPEGHPEATSRQLVVPSIIEAD